MSTKKFIPNFIRKNMTYKTHDILTAQEYNAILNLLITQGDYNAGWLDYMYNTYIPETILGMGEEAITEKINRRIAAIAAANVNKTYNILNAPMFSFLDVSIQSSLVGFRNLLDNYNIPGTVCIATNMLDTSAAFPTLANIKALHNAGHAVIPVGTDGSPLNNVDAASLVHTLGLVEDYMNTNGLGTPNVFLYPDGLVSDTLVDTVSSKYEFAINTSQAHTDIDSENTLNILYNIPVIFINNSTDLAALKAYIDDTVATNRYCIFAVNSGASTYDTAKLEEVIKYVQSKVAAVIATVPTGLELCISTINNRFRRVDTAFHAVDRRIKELAGTVKELAETVKGAIDALGGLKLSYKDGNFYISNGTKTKKLGSSEGTATTNDVLVGVTFNSANTPDSIDYSTGTMKNNQGKTIATSGYTKTSTGLLVNVPERACYDTNSKLTVAFTGVPTFIPLGTGTSFDVRSVYSDYTKLNANNFVVEPVSMSISSSGAYDFSDGYDLGSNSIDASGSGGFSKSYNNGVLTCSMGASCDKEDVFDHNPTRRIWTNGNARVTSFRAYLIVT